MKILTKNDYNQVRLWMYRNARQLELTLWQYYFEHGSKEEVLSALSVYQNEDGGFGNALEPDNWNPESSPYTTQHALRILKDIEFFDKEHPIVQGIIRFFDSGVYCLDEGWFFNLPSNNNFAHAPWWTFNMEENATESVGLTAEIACLLLIYADKNSPLYQKVMGFSRNILDKLKERNQYGDMGLGGYCSLMEATKYTELGEFYDYSQLSEQIGLLVNDSIERDITKWPFYTRRPSDYIHSPESIFYKENEQILNTELDYLIDTRHQDGVWDITWSWFDNNEKYSKEFAISENWWKAIKAIDKIKFLGSFKRIEG